MSRKAVLIGNSVSYLSSQRGVTPSILRRTIRDLERHLSRLGPDYSFDVTTAIDLPASKAKAIVEAGATATGASGSLLLIYYFGHGALHDDYTLQLVHPGETSPTTLLKLSAVESLLSEHDVQKSITLLDCCFAGAKARTFGNPPPGQHCRIACTTPTSRAYIVSDTPGEPPIGAFTQTLLDAFNSQDATVSVSATDNRVTAQSLYAYAREATVAITNGQQQPRLLGGLVDTLFEYVPTPRILAGVNDEANPKTAYRKLLALCQTLRATRCDSLRDLYDAVLKDHRDAFETTYYEAPGTIRYGPVQPHALVRYIRFLTALGLVEADSLRLTTFGRELMREWKTRFNEGLLRAIDAYLAARNLSRQEIEKSLREILAARGVPSRSEVAARLARTGHRVPSSDVGMILDILGYARAIKMTREPAYFPW